LADLFCRQARLRTEALFAALWDNTDAVDVAAARRIVDGRYVYLEEGVLPLPEQGDWVAAWQPGPSTERDVRRRVQPVAPSPSEAAQP
jgi:hypothetical protein